MNDVERFRTQAEELLGEKNQIIQDLVARLHSQQEVISLFDATVGEFNDGYIKTSLTELEDLGYVLTNGIGDKCQKFIFLNVTKMNPLQNIIQHRNSQIIVAEEIGDYIVSSQISEKVEYSNNFCEMLIKDLHRLEETVGHMQEEINKLSLEKNQLEMSLKEEKIHPNRRIKHQTTMEEKPKTSFEIDRRARTHKGISRSNASKNRSQNYDFQDKKDEADEKHKQLEEPRNEIKNEDSFKKNNEGGLQKSQNKEQKKSEEKIPTPPLLDNGIQLNRQDSESPKKNVPIYWSKSIDYEQDTLKEQADSSVKKLPDFNRLFPTYQYNVSAPAKSKNMPEENNSPANSSPSATQKKEKKKLINLFPSTEEKPEIHDAQKSPTEIRNGKISQLKLPSLREKRTDPRKAQDDEGSQIPLSPLVRKKNPNSKIIYIRR